MLESFPFDVMVKMKDFHSVTEVTEVLEKYGTKGMQIKIDKNASVEAVGEGSMTEILLLALRLHELKCHMSCHFTLSL